MKTQKVFLIILLMSLPLEMFSQVKAVGIRFGGGNTYGAEISYQAPFLNERLEANLGLGIRSNDSSARLSAVYQWLFPIESGFNWYAGFGPGITIASELNLGISGNLGIEYNFNPVPLQLSLDTRPLVNLLNSSHEFWNIALGIRVKF